MKTIRRLAIVPARGGSKRIPHKNIRSFGGRPIISYVLDSARASGLFEVIHVSTEDPGIRRTVEELGYPVDFPRPASLADDVTPIMPVLKYVTETYADRGEDFEEVWLLMPCAALVEPSDLVLAADMFGRTARRLPLLAVAAYEAPVQWAYRRAEDGILTPLQPGMFAVRSQDLEKSYYDTGTFAAFPTAMVRDSEGAGPGDAFVGYLLDRHKGIDIDDESDWEFAESLMRLKRE